MPNPVPPKGPKRPPLAKRAQVEGRAPEAEPAPPAATGVPGGPFNGPFGSLLNVTHDAIVLVDESQHVIGFNPAAEVLFACSAGEALGLPLDRFLPHGARQVHARHVERFAASAEVRRRLAPVRRVTALRADGSEIAVELTLSSVDAVTDGAPRHWSAALLRDLSTEEALRFEVDIMKRRLYAALDATPAAVWISDNERIVYANRVAARLAGVADGEALGSRTLASLLTPPTLAALRAACASPNSESMVRVAGQLQRADGQLREIEIALASLPDHGHSVMQMVVDDVTERRRAAAEQERAGGALRRLQASVVEAREEERRRIARELHDELGQRLTALKMEVSGLAGRAGLRAADMPVSSMLTMLDETVAAVRRIASDLRPLMLDDLGLNAAIEWLARDTARRTGVEIAVQLAELPGPPGGRLATALYRMVQEALTNVVRHAQARHVQVQLQLEGEAAVLTVSDDGVGLSEPAAAREDAYGLLGMRERAAMLGGSLTIDNREGGGARLEVRVPLERKGRTGP